MFTGMTTLTTWEKFQFQARRLGIKKKIQSLRKKIRVMLDYRNDVEADDMLV